jgi:hypothetical protein
MASDETGASSPPPPTSTPQNGKLEKQRKLLETAFDCWRARLLDLTARNRALNYRPTKVSTQEIQNPAAHRHMSEVAKLKVRLARGEVVPLRRDESA